MKNYSNDQLYKARAKNSLGFFLEYETSFYTQDGGISIGYDRAPHLDLLCKELEKIEQGENDRLIITLPPRHGKSHCTSQKFPAWYLGRNPDKEVIISCYGAELAYDFSREARDTLREWGPDIFGVSISENSSAVKHWEIEGHDGGLTAAGVGGPLTGRGAHLAIIDDPFKNSEEANSSNYREKVYNWYKTVLRTRLAPGAAIILIQTRWHEDDLAGKLIDIMENDDEDTEEWRILNMKAISAEEDQPDPLGREPGQALWPKQYPLEELRRVQKTLGLYWWESLYQQSPKPLEGKHFKRENFQYFEEGTEHYILHKGQGKKRWLKHNCITFQTCDPAGSEAETADYFVLQTWIVTPDGELLLRDVMRLHIEGPDQPQLFMQGWQRWGPLLQGVEPAGIGLTLFQSIRRMGLPVVELKPDRDKITRALPMAARYQSKDVYHYKNASWLGEYEEELIAFPHGKNDDQVDAAAYAAIMALELEEYLEEDEEGDTVIHEEEGGISPY